MDEVLKFVITPIGNGFLLTKRCPTSTFSCDPRRWLRGYAACVDMLYASQ
jgi:hypothetical protein